MPETGEISHLLAFSRELSSVVTGRETVTVLGAALARALPWRTLAVLAGDEAAAGDVVLGGDHLDGAARHAFERSLARAGAEHGVVYDALVWQTPVAGAPAVTPSAPLVILPVGRRAGRTGLVAVEPQDGAPLTADVRRLLGGLVQHAALVLDRVERARAERETALATVLAAVPCGVLILDDGGRLRQTNPAAERLLRSLSGREPRPGIRLVEIGLAFDAVAPGQAVEFSSCVDQRTYELTLPSLAVGADAGRRTFILEDVTVDRARGEQAVQTERLTALGEMLSGVVHELNNPLSTVIGYAQLLARRPLEDGVRDRLRVVAEEASRCRRIVQNLLDVAHSRAPENVPLNLNDLIDGVLELFAYRLRVEGIEVEWARALHLPLVCGDRHRLQQVLVNLLSNADHALRTRAAPRRIHIVAQASGGRVLVEVADNGPGIPATYRERVFEPFFTTKEVGVGTGLGLPLAARTLREHGGRLSVRPGTGGGATFVLDLPALREQVASSADAASDTVDRSSYRILVVDDEEGFRQLLQEALAEEGHQVRCAENGEVALRILQEATFDLVLSDLRMPVVSGRELFERLVQRGSRVAQRFLFMSGDALGEEVRRFFDEHGLACLRKPFGLDELDRALRAALAGDGGAPRPVVDLRQGRTHETSP